MLNNDDNYSFDYGGNLIYFQYKISNSKLQKAYKTLTIMSQPFMCAKGS